ncbi:MAG: RsmE family RNA methyltransferase [Burkholderiaceae bacterium]
MRGPAADRRARRGPPSLPGRAQHTPAAGVALAIGPESGFSEAEISAATAAGAQPVSLGPRVWRTETAGLAGLVMLHALLGDLQ